MIQGVQHAAKVRIRVEPFAKGIQPVTVTNSLDHGLPSEMLSVVLEELESAGQGGGLLGFPLMRLKVTVLGGEVDESRAVGDRLSHGREPRLRHGAARSRAGAAWSRS